MSHFGKMKDLLEDESSLLQSTKEGMVFLGAGKSMRMPTNHCKRHFGLDGSLSNRCQLS